MRIGGSIAGTARFQGMDTIIQARDLREMLSVARQLRGVAQESDAHADRALFGEAADALEARAQWMAATLPDERHGDGGTAPFAHIDVVV